MGKHFRDKSEQYSCQDEIYRSCPMHASQNQQSYLAQFFPSGINGKCEAVMPIFEVIKELIFICRTSAMPGNTRCHVISKSNKLFVLLSNNLFTAGDIFGSLSVGLHCKNW